jgi:hypothetical protein
VRRPVVLSLAVAVAGLGALGANAASAATVCAGTAETFAACATPNPGALPSVNPTGSSISDCVYAGPPPCVPVSVPVPTTSPGTGFPLSVRCGGPIVTSNVSRLCATLFP